MATIRKRGARWQVQVRRKGCVAQARTFPRKADAEAWARRLEAELDQGSQPADRKQLQATTMAALLMRYAEEVTPRKKSRESETWCIRAMASHPIGQLTLDKVTASRLALYRDERLKIVRPSTVRRQFTILRRCLEVAIREWGVPLPANPLKGLWLPQEGPARERRVSPQELERLALAIRDTRNRLLVSIVNLAIFTGMRRSELLGLTWRNLDQKKGLAFLPDTKNGHPRFVPLCPAARNVIAGLTKGEPEHLVLPMSANAVRLSWGRLTRRAGIEDLRFHDLRHEAVSRFFEAGLSVPEVSLISGHRDPRMLLRYTHLRPEAVAQKLKTAIAAPSALFDALPSASGEQQATPTKA